MNTHLSELLSWLLEPLADATLGRSYEVISDEHLKQKIVTLNDSNKEWVPATEMECQIGESLVMEDALAKAPG